MMKTKNQTRKINKLVLIIALALLAGLVALLLYMFVFKPNDDSATRNTDSNKTTSSDQQDSEDLDTIDDDKTTPPNTDLPATPTPTPESNKKQVQMVASVNQSDDTVFIRGGVNYPVTGGACYAQLSGPFGKTIRKDSSILPNPASTDCKTISIPVSELGAGKWIFTLNYESDEYKGVSNEASFTL